MPKKEKIAIHRDKRMEPIDIELDEAMGLLDNANRQITDLLATMDAPSPGLTAEDSEAPPAPGETVVPVDRPESAQPSDAETPNETNSEQKETESKQDG